MARRPLIRSNEHYYHVTARSNNRENFFLPIQEVWDIMCKKLAFLQREHEIKIAAFVLMNNHFHLVVLSPSESIDKVMYFFMKDVTRDIQKKTGRINKIFGGRYKGSLIHNEAYLRNVYKYVYRNPVQANMVTKAEDYNFSSFKIGNILRFKVEKIFENFFEYEAKWINESFLEIERDSIKRGLKKTVFTYPKERSTGRILVSD